jgi:hypothetical protein
MCRVGDEDEDMIISFLVRAVAHLKEQKYAKPLTTHLLRIRKWPIRCSAGAEHGGS